MIKVCHMTSVHESLDVRIFLKECVSLRKRGYDVSLVAKGESFVQDGVKIIGIGACERNRIARFIKVSRRIFEKALAVDADIYHFHDPELIPYAKKLKKLGKKVIYDSHEDVPRQILSKGWIPALLRKTISKVYERYEKSSSRDFDMVIAATPHIAKIFKHYGSKVCVVKNYPIIDDISGDNEDFVQRANIICYAGGITEVRGLTNLVESISALDVELYLAGAVDKEYKQRLEKSKGWRKVNYLGFLNREDLNNMYNQSCIGIATLLATPNHVKSLPIKMFEYMAAGIPVICSDFPLWKEIIENADCGLCIDPEDKTALKRSVTFLLENKEKAKEMGDKGRQAVLEKYNWSIEEEKLWKAYKCL
jgi:glycosyltransferase involved in cell wall biosynthesis